MGTQIPPPVFGGGILLIFSDLQIRDFKEIREIKEFKDKVISKFSKFPKNKTTNI